MIESRLPIFLWPEAVATSVFLINRLPTKILNKKTPLDILSKQTKIPAPLSLSPKVFGCTAYVHIPKHERSKLEPCARKCVFVGYGVNQKGYRCFDPTTKKIITTMNCDFLETEFFYTNQPSGQGESDRDHSWLVYEPNQSFVDQQETPAVTTAEHTSSLELPMYSPIESPTPISEVTSEPSEDEDVIPTNTADSEEDNTIDGDTGRYILPPRSTRGIPPKRYSPERISSRSKYGVASLATRNLSETARSFEAALYKEDEVPRNVEEAMESEHWREAMKTEMEALERNNTWVKSELPKGVKPVGCRWVFTVKRRPDGSIDRYKARLVAKGYTQTYGIDYDETFSPVAKINTLRVLFSIAANKDWPLHQYDVTNAFLHGELQKPVFMCPPPGYTSDFVDGEVCQLKKTLYGLKQSPRAWFGRFTVAMKKYGYKQSNSDHTLFLKRKGEKITCLVIYVDDMIITGDDVKETDSLRENLFSEFSMKDLGPLKYFLGIEVLRSKRGIFISQRKYILDILTEVGMLECKPASTPMIPNHKLRKVEGAEMADRGRYQRLVGRLIYLSHTRPDIAYAVGIVSQFMHSPQKDHWKAAIRIVQYLKGTVEHGLLFRNHGHLDICGFTDADWAGNPNDMRSTAGYFTFVGGNLVTWRSKKQKVVALSSAEAEFRGIKNGLTEILWLRKLMMELCLFATKTCQLFCDNKAAISISENPVQHDRTKHVEIDRHFIKEKIEGKIVELPFVRSEDQLADILTKAVSVKGFREALSKLSIGDPNTQLEGECWNGKESLIKQESRGIGD